MADIDRLPPAVQRALRPFLADDSPRVAVFDADGTLWRGDVGEDLLRYLGVARALPAVAEGAFARYEALHAERPVDAYAWAVEAMAGLAEVQLCSLCDDFFTRRFAGRVFPWVRPLFGVLETAGVAVWICSASPRWIVEAGGRALGLPVERVIGVDAEVEGGALTARVKRPVTAGPGKVAWLEQRARAWGFAAGNGALDVDMLERARHRLVVTPFDGVDNALVTRARRDGWPVLQT
ncbi:MAG: haloacid dehalogenase-like hydrolase [Myxococcaceae bacterium]|jgi:phosphatidylglycerophosphatase C|nr:haloacid dehalogenase-like hydrolase [Myxococcaceae bacterium]MCA3011550.1 haloacid dehalogenase-like hydrolase [Myxococcaceae bacterium]